MYLPDTFIEEEIMTILLFISIHQVDARGKALGENSPSMFS